MMQKGCMDARMETMDGSWSQGGGADCYDKDRIDVAVVIMEKEKMIKGIKNTVVALQQ